MTNLPRWLWPEIAPGAWEAALHALVSKLRSLFRRLVDPEAISLTSAFGTYLLRLGEDVWVDREAAAEAVDLAEGFARAQDWKSAWAPANIAALAARWLFLGSEDGPWIRRERSHLHEILVRALDCLVEVWMANGEPAQELGNRAEALRVYEDCRELLVTEFGANPSRETQALYLELLQGS